MPSTAVQIIFQLHVNIRQRKFCRALAAHDQLVRQIIGPRRDRKGLPKRVQPAEKMKAQPSS